MSFWFIVSARPADASRTGFLVGLLTNLLSNNALIAFVGLRPTNRMFSVRSFQFPVSGFRNL
jgi:hypothetical protein